MSSYATAGLYRMTVEEMLYTPRTQVEKKKFEGQDQLTGVKRVTKLLGKFESGNLDQTMDQSEAELSIHFATPPPQPKPRTSVMTSTPIKNNSPRFEAPEIEDLLEESFAKLDLVETPILRQPHRRVGYSAIRDKMSMMDKGYQTPVQKKSILKKTYNSAGSTYSSASSSASSGTPSSGKSTRPIREAVNKYPAEIREQVHQKFNKYFSWSAELLQTIASHVAETRLEALHSIQPTEVVRCLQSMYQLCLDGSCKEMNALCSALFDLLGSGVNMQKVSIHEEYVVMKYSKKL
ncbi:hypothetical protein L5515_006691 [Caenorhabditis briggsae]|uniref:Uncharacterized protein n=1 Tax=Caenorhabditis briggsae TaxID=6238 RepID=A0AAE9F2X3_CAEBR|nr:hypothetical protein L5515_006691 [Caenorhabditis briggsae]